ncbi:hypothetical protein [Citrobacter freundii]|uniref:hypothetical protein n=1 Tax=Citrobacter freundii TaxID=546 RepID=UPI00259F3FB1|nr:hypothetical protein [Citrobacter freundii]EJK5499873.1 hypothetical protein [Citrobacter freundii]EKU1724130.1 hypothetical protein [Citrobacter freundii]EKV0354806.1 hypothetical protein [Citrobacter freundii]EKV0475124.1 hypothetical protein [Citrobacter freundii]
MSKLTRLEKYHLNYVSQRQVSKVVAVTPAAMEVEKRARIAIRRDQCISKGNGLRRGEYAGIGCRGVVYD